ANANGDAVAGKTKAALCAGCHGAGGNSVVPIFPKLAGQHAQYLEQSMKEFRSKTRTGANAAQMYPMVASLSDQDIADLAAYFASN
ncbi:MAG: cytochrome c, partial [Gammaproteobacteria bacterium]|nr:cytochrome c [Gammaproteobacteria bacterium]